MDNKMYIIWPVAFILTMTFHCFNALTMPFEAGQINTYEDWSSGTVKFEYFNRTEKNFRGNVTLNFPGEECYTIFTVLKQKGNTWTLYATFNRSFCDVWTTEKFLLPQLLEQTNAPRTCPFPNGTVLCYNGLHFDPSGFMNMIPGGLRMGKFVMEIFCKGQRAFDSWVDVIFDQTDDKKRRGKPGQRPRN